MNSTSHNTGNEHTVTVTVNSKEVAVMGPKATGSEIKDAAITAGLSVQLDFLLSQERANGDLVRIGDNDVITVNRQSAFTLVSPDHNS